jgi:hypothetical protein
MEEEGWGTAIQVPPIHLLVSTSTAETAIAGRENYSDKCNHENCYKTCESEGRVGPRKRTTVCAATTAERKLIGVMSAEPRNCEAAVARERLCKHARCWAMTQYSSRYGLRDTHAITEVLEAMFSLWSVPILYSED